MSYQKINSCPQPHDVWIFTDGACSGNPGRGGWAWAAIIPEIEFYDHDSGASEQTTNNEMELTAALHALQFSHGKFPERRIWIFTDSTYLIQGLESWIFSWERRDWTTVAGEAVKNQALWKNLAEMQAKIGKQKIRGLNLIKIPAHAGWLGNELVDGLAQYQAQSKNRMGAAVSCPEKPDPKTWIPRVVEQTLELFDEAPQSSAPQKKASGKPTYLSYVDGRLERHATWPECEARVKGKKGAKFKKVLSREEESQVLSSWGV